jgi:hypothetical protein
MSEAQWFAGGCRKACRSPQWPAMRAPQATDCHFRSRCVSRSMDISASRSALAGADQKILILSDGDARAVMRHHANIISAGTAASLRHVTFTSIVDVEARSPFYDAPVYRDADRLEDRGIPTTIVRCAYTQISSPCIGLRPALNPKKFCCPPGRAVWRRSRGTVLRLPSLP